VSQVATGRVTDRPLGRTIYTIGVKRFTGDLILRQDRRTYKLGWRNGLVVAADSPAPADTVGRIGVAVGLLTPEHLSDSLRALAMGGKRSKYEVMADIAEL